MRIRNVLGVILAGGSSTRMGRDKADVRVGEKTMLEMVGEALATETARVVVAGSERQGWECWPDIVAARGPLAGIATALGRTETPHILAVGVDHPFVRPETLAKMLDLTDRLPVVPVDHNGIRQVTCAVYPKTIAAVATEEAEGGGSVQSLLDRVAFTPITPAEWSAWGEDGRSWFSVNTPKALEEATARYGA